MTVPSSPCTFLFTRSPFSLLADFVCAQLGGIEIFRTKPKKKTLNPVWDRELIENITVQDKGINAYISWSEAEG